MKKRHFGSWALGAAFCCMSAAVMFGVGAHDGGPLLIGYVLSLLLAVPLTIIDVVRLRDTQSWLTLAVAFGIVLLYR